MTFDYNADAPTLTGPFIASATGSAPAAPSGGQQPGAGGPTREVVSIGGTGARTIAVGGSTDRPG